MRRGTSGADGEETVPVIVGLGEGESKQPLDGGRGWKAVKDCLRFTAEGEKGKTTEEETSRKSDAGASEAVAARDGKTERKRKRKEE